MFNASPLYQSQFAHLFDRIDTDKLFKALVILMDDNRPDPRLQPIAANTGLVFGVLSYFSGDSDSPNIPDDLLYSVSRASQALLTPFFKVVFFLYRIAAMG